MEAKGASIAGGAEGTLCLPAAEWLSLFQSRSPRAIAALEAIYGTTRRHDASPLEQRFRSEILEGRIEKYIAALESFRKEYPDLLQENVAIGMLIYHEGIYLTY